MRKTILSKKTKKLQEGRVKGVFQRMDAGRGLDH
jgi:hypothetical protein